MNLHAWVGNCGAALVAVLALTACGGGGSDTNPDPPPPAQPVARVVIDPGALLLTAAGEARALKARAFDAGGREVAAEFRWSSSRSAVVAVDALGVATAAAATGSAQIVAEAGGVRSAPVIALVAQPVAGALLVADAQVIGDPVEADPAAAPSTSNTYLVTLEGVAAPALDQVLIGTGAKPIAGRVVAVQTLGTQVRVTLRPLPPAELFTQLRVQESFDLSRAEVQIPADVAAAFDVKREGDRFVFTQKPGAGAGAAQRKTARQAVSGTFALGPFADCEAKYPDLNNLPGAVPLAIDTPLSFAVTVTPSYEFDYDSASGLNKLLLKAEPKFEMKLGLAMAVATSASYGCKKKLFQFVIPFSGPLAWLAGGVVPVGIGFDAGGKITVANAKLGLETKSEGKVELGVACPGGACGIVNKVEEGPMTAVPVLKLPALGDPRFEPSLAAYASVKLALGNPAFSSLQFELIDSKLAGTLKGSFALAPAQIADAGYKSDYKLSLDISAKAGSDVVQALQLIGAVPAPSLELKVSVPLAASPKGSVSADAAQFTAGQTVNVGVTIDAGSEAFFPGAGPYNIERVVLVRKALAASAVEVASVVAAEGQKSFSIPWVAPEAGKAEELHAFVVTRLLPLDLLALEIGQAKAVAAPMPARLMRGYIETSSHCTAVALDESQTDPADTTFAADQDSEYGGLPSACSVSLAGITASGAELASAAGTEQPFSDPGLPVDEIDFAGSFQATAELGVPPLEGRNRVATTSSEAYAGGNWTFGTVAPVSYTLTATLTAPPGAFAEVILRTQAVPAPSNPLEQRVTICALVPAPSSEQDWVQAGYSTCDGAEATGTKTVTLTGTLLPGERLEVRADSGGGWGARRGITSELNQGPTGSRTTSGSLTMKLTFAPVQ
jgi:hypothetical protein